MLGLRFCARAFSSCGKRRPLFMAVRGPLTMAASLVAEHRLQTRRLSNCGSRAQLLRVMWDPPRPGREPVSPALAGRFSTTAPPGKPGILFFKSCLGHFVKPRIQILSLFLRLSSLSFWNSFMLLKLSFIILIFLYIFVAFWVISSLNHQSDMSGGLRAWTLALDHLVCFWLCH